MANNVQRTLPTCNFPILKELFQIKTSARDKEIAAALNHSANLNGAEDSYPRGAIAFFIGLIAGFVLIWAGVYLLMFHRQFHL
ncbi:MAG: hypothetical protein LAO19_15390 [Acidobacteriia bacterium]|nr:hypothetical protein [Terriglobia bacterium]